MYSKIGFTAKKSKSPDHDKCQHHSVESENSILRAQVVGGIIGSNGGDHFMAAAGGSLFRYGRAYGKLSEPTYYGFCRCF
ncbi:hypothetical protein G4B88_005161 [Cannabis sativa]|uniref:Uncharacterized protein n=1 Tax=Cannabis sativa TaxID=3483 RepID=A0A7J6ESJ7_CANSA|nr:hypothetical protein G4B88_005161 [Cannabis sativa]